jgi:uncharacterized phage-associated protein
MRKFRDFLDEQMQDPEFAEEFKKLEALPIEDFDEDEAAMWAEEYENFKRESKAENKDIYDARDIAKFFFKLDKDEALFPKEKMIIIEGMAANEGNIRINKFLHLSQNTYIAKYGKKLFYNDLYAFDDGGVVKEVQANYQTLKSTGISDLDELEIDEDIQYFLKSMFCLLKDVPIKELIEISQEDDEWERKTSLSKGKQLMDSLSNKDEYKEQYEDVLYLFSRDYFSDEIKERWG